jgi:hypothetical protein
MAGVFFDDADNLSVLTQDGVVESFYSSSFFHLLDQCIVYLDDAHTRGTDLKLPLNFRAVVTLGPKVTKDRLVQGMSSFVPLPLRPVMTKNPRLHAYAKAGLRAIRCLLCSTRS